MSTTTIQDAFEDLIKDMYSAEKQVLHALPKAAKGATDGQLSAAIEAHIKQTEEHVTRLEGVAQSCGFTPTGKACAAAKGIIEEMAEGLEENEKGAVRDAVIVCAGQKFEHYEIANYGTAVAWANLLGEKEAVELLNRTLKEEEETNVKLTEIAETSVNQAALEVREDEPARK